MTRIAKASSAGGRFVAVTFAAALSVTGNGLSARAESLPASASIVRNTIIAMSLADAALPVATAVSMTRDVPALVPISSAAMKPETSGAMAAMRTVSARRSASAYDGYSYDRRVRAYRDPFIMMLGVAY